MNNEVYIITEFVMSNHNDRYNGVHSIHSNPKSVLVKYSDCTVGGLWLTIKAIEEGELFYKDNSYFQITKQPLLDMS